jgi:hypothetical protein
MSLSTPLGHLTNVTVSTALFFRPCYVYVAKSCCASVFKGSIRFEIQPSQISSFNTRVSPYSFDSPSYISFLCQFLVDDGGYIKALL